jgi:hypothetical protein
MEGRGNGRSWNWRVRMLSGDGLGRELGSAFRVRHGTGLVLSFSSRLMPGIIQVQPIVVSEGHPSHPIDILIVKEETGGLMWAHGSEPVIQLGTVLAMKPTPKYLIELASGEMRRLSKGSAEDSELLIVLYIVLLVAHVPVRGVLDEIIKVPALQRLRELHMRPL